MTGRSGRGLLASAIAAIISGGASSAISAQETNETIQAGGEPLEEITVTGSRLRRSGMTTATPVTALNLDELSVMNPDMFTALADLPQFLDSQRAEAGGMFSRTQGQSFLNLRSLGSSRMLTLLNGRRVVPTSIGGEVNINMFPQGIMQAVEVVTGGASAAYGSDAVAGVTNLILDTEFTGISGNFAGGRTSRNENDNFRASIAGGTSIGERSHLLFGADIFEAEAIPATHWRKRDWWQSWGRVLNPDPNGPEFITLPDVGNNTTSATGLILSGPLAGTHFSEDGRATAFDYGPLAGDGVWPEQNQYGGDAVNFQEFHRELYPTTKRKSAFVHFQTEPNDNVRLFAYGLAGHNLSDEYTWTLAMDGRNAMTIFRDNPFIPGEVQEQMDLHGLESFVMQRRTTEADGFTDHQAQRSMTASGTVGFEMDVSDWRVSTSYQYGENKRSLNASQARMDHVFDAIDAVRHPETGQIVCRSTVTTPNNGCKPANFFGSGQVSSDAIDYFHTRYGGTDDSKKGFTKTYQHFAEVLVDGNVLDGWVDEGIPVVAGVSYRREGLESDITRDVHMPNAADVDYHLPASLSGSIFGFQVANMLVVSGEYDVKEAFAETIIPVLAGNNLAESLEVNLAARYADYAGSGDAWAWKAGVDWQMTPDLRFRATRSQDIRAANLEERWNTQVGDGGVDDPWVGFNHTPIDRTGSGGNPEVAPEVGQTLTVGAVYQPEWAPGLGLSVDWYEIRVEDAIASIGTGNIIEFCFEQNLFCHLVERDDEQGSRTGFPGMITHVNNTYQNLEELGVRGVDVEVNYRRPVELFGGGENVAFRAIVGHLGERALTDQDGNKTDTVGSVSRPEWQGTISLNYSRGPFTLATSGRYLHSTERSLNEVEGVDIDRNHVSSVYYQNLRATYNFEGVAGSWEFFGHVQNLFDRAPPVVVGNNIGRFSAGTNTGVFDYLGRRYTLGLQFQY